MTYEEQCEVERLNKQIIESINGEELIAFYKEHNQAETMLEFGLRTTKQLKKALTKFSYDFSFKKALNKGKPATRSHDSYVKGGEKSAQTQKQHWAEKSDEEKEVWSIKQSIAHTTSPTFKAKITASNKAYRAALTPEQRADMDARRSQTMKLWWQSLSKEEQDAIQANRFINGRTYHIKDSGPNKAFADKLTDAGIEFEREYCLDQKFFDFKVGNTLIEINPTFTHNSSYNPFGNKLLPHTYHKEKSELAKKYGFKCIHIFDWDDHYKVIKQLREKKTLYARNLTVEELTIDEARTFTDLFHYQGAAKDEIRLGLIDAELEETVMIMTFGKPRYNKNYQYELIRLCTREGYKIVGGAEKLFKYFIDKYNPDSIVSYCDCSKFTGEIYTKLGFELFRKPQPSKHWYNHRTNEHCLDSLLRQQGFDRLFGTCFGKGTSNEELMLQHGFVEIYDCGQASFGWHKQV